MSADAVDWIAAGLLIEAGGLAFLALAVRAARRAPDDSDMAGA